MEAAEDSGPRPGWHHRGPRAQCACPRGPAVQRPRLGDRRPLLPAERDGLRRHRVRSRAVRHRPDVLDDPAWRRHHRCRQVRVRVQRSRPAQRSGQRRVQRRAHRRPRPADGARRRRGRCPAAGQHQQHAAHQQHPREQRWHLRRRHRPRPAVRARKPQLQRPDRERPHPRQRRADQFRRHRHLLRLQQLRRRGQHLLLELRGGVRRRHLALGPEPRRRDPRQPDLLQRRRRLGRRDRGPDGVAARRRLHEPRRHDHHLSRRRLRSGEDRPQPDPGQLLR